MTDEPLRLSEMSRSELESKVLRLRERADWQKRCRILELRDQERARQIREMAGKLQAAERNAMRFHALLLQERVRHLPKEKT